MSVPIGEIPRVLVLEPRRAVAVEFTIRQPACEIDIRLEGRRPGRSIVVMIGSSRSSLVQRARIAGRAELYFEPQRRGAYVLMLTNPMGEPAVIHLRGRNVPEPIARPRVTISRSRVPSGTKRPRTRRTRIGPTPTGEPAATR